MMNSKVWDKPSCLKYLREFDAFEHKYLDNNPSRLADLKPEFRMAWDKILNSQSHGISNHNFSRSEESEAAQGIKQVYCDEKHYTNEYIEILNLVRDKFIYDYTGISGLCDFFSPAYFEYEWGMHLEIDYDHHTSRFYRDHYMHQIRNMFEAFTLLDNFGYYEKCREAYNDPGNNIGTFIREAIQQEILSMNPTDMELYGKVLALRNKDGIRSFVDDASIDIDQLKKYYGDSHDCRSSTCFRNKVDSLVKKRIQDFKTEFAYSKELLSGVYRNISKDNSEMLQDLMLRYVIYSAVIIASIVHDIGYPISYIRRISGRLNSHLPISNLLAASSSDYSKIYRALQNSLLFKVVDHEKIKRRLTCSDEHGVQSAIVLLMYFHRNGDGLSFLQKCAIDVAALVIYNHTNKYSVIDKEKDGKPETIPELVRSDIYKEPISHVFRLCDDLQEWDRVYFEVTDKSNLMICPKCKTPITRKFGTDIDKPENKRYYCCCSTKEDGPYDTNLFVNRRILNVIGCDSMHVDEIKSNVELVGTKFTMNYDCAKLLNIMTFSTTYAKTRAKAIRELKILHSYQGQYDTILVDSFVSGNPLTVKIRILECFLKLSEKTGYLNYTTEIGKINYVIDFVDSKDSFVKELWRKSLYFYLELTKLGATFKKECKDTIENDFVVVPTINHYFKDCISGYNKLIKNISAIPEDFHSELDKLGVEFSKACNDIISHFKVNNLNASNSTIAVFNNFISDYDKLKRGSGTSTTDTFDLNLMKLLINFKEAYNGIAKKELSLGVNTTNNGVLKKYKEAYDKLCEELLKKARKKLSNDKCSLKQYFQDETMLTLGCDYLMYQAHLLGYEETKNALEGNSSDNDVRMQNLYRQFYENINCSNDYLCNQVDKYISREAYDRVKEACIEENSTEMAFTKNHIDFFVDYALFIKLWNKINCKDFYFDSEDEESLEKSDERLECLTVSE